MTNEQESDTLQTPQLENITAVEFLTQIWNAFTKGKPLQRNIKISLSKELFEKFKSELIEITRFSVVNGCSCGAATEEACECGGYFKVDLNPMLCFKSGRVVINPLLHGWQIGIKNEDVE